jgi:predicted aminopeptidase
MRGQYQILTLQEPVRELIASQRTTSELKKRFILLNHLRGFAETELGLPVDGHYRKYADLGRRFVVWNVEAAPALSMQPKSWWYPVVGRLEYRGYFKEASARKYGEILARKGWDVHISGATAYSTLGWFKDPVLNTFVMDPEPFFAETLFHELAHQQLFVSGDKDFNEAFATFVGREGVQRWLLSQQRHDDLEQYLAQTRREDQFADLVVETRSRLERMYGDVRDKKGRIRSARQPGNVPRNELLVEKQRVFDEMRARYHELKQHWAGNPAYDNWFARPINNAKLNSVAAYHEFVPGFARLLELNQGDLNVFYREAERLGGMKKEERHRWLRLLPLDRRADE